ncbi:hypothetical protein Hanom_Chr11g01038761 [Helianthus anomalus]
MAKKFRESKINKALTDRTIVYESHVRRFWSSVSDNDPIIIPERLCKGLWCRMGLTGHLNRKYH